MLCECIPGFRQDMPHMVLLKKIQEDYHEQKTF